MKSLELEDYDIEYQSPAKFIGNNFYVYYRRKGSDEPYERLTIPFYWYGDIIDFEINYTTFRELKLREYCDGI